MARSGELKVEVLRAIRDGARTAAEISEATGRDGSVIGPALTLYARQKLIEVVDAVRTGSRGRPPHIYELTQRGRDRLEYLLKRKTEAEE